MTRRTLTTLVLTATATGITSWWAATLWWGRCASGCRRGASIGAGSVSVDPWAVSGRETGAQRLPLGWETDARRRLFQIDPWVAYAAELDAELMTSNPDLYFAQARERARRFVRRTA